MLPRDPLGRPPGDSLTPPGTRIKETLGGNPNLQPETAYEWTYGIVWTPAKLIKGLTLGADFYHIDLRNPSSIAVPAPFWIITLIPGRGPSTALPGVVNSPRPDSAQSLWAVQM